MRRFLLILLYFAVPASSFCQASKKEDSLRQVYALATTEIDQYNALRNLADFYFENDQPKNGVAALKDQLRIAELRGDKELTNKAYFQNSITTIPSWAPAEDFDAVVQFINQSIEHAKKSNDRKYIAVGYIKLSSVRRKQQQAAEAVDASTIALATLTDESDSLKAAVYIELGESYRLKKDAVLACRSYNNAYDISLKQKNPFLESRVYQCLSELYSSLEDSSEASHYLHNSVQINRKYGFRETLMKNYIDLARLTDDTSYTVLALSLADSLNHQRFKLRAKEVQFVIYFVKFKDSEKAISYLNTQPELLKKFTRDGIEDYQYELGLIYRFCEKPDSALHYFKMAESALLKKYNPHQARSLFADMAACYAMKNDRANAVSYYEKAFGISSQINDYDYVSTIADSLSVLFKETGDLKSAISYMEISTNTKTKLAALAKDKELTRLSVDRERSLHDEDLKQQKLALKKKRDIQYMSITVAICLVFVLTLILGMFPISKLTIKILGYFFFISVFEFIILVLDNDVLHGITYGEPLKLWLIKIVLIGSLVPLQHWLEHKLIHFLESRKLLKARTSFSFKKWLPKRKPIIIAQPPVAVEEKQNEPAV